MNEGTLQNSTSFYEKGLPCSDSDSDFDIWDGKRADDLERPNLHRYKIVRPIGHGGMGVVFEAKDLDLERFVALKVLRRKHRTNQRMLCRFSEEAKTTARLQHPGVVAIYDIGETEKGRPFFAMKLVRGHTLAEQLCSERGAPAELSRSLSIFANVCQTIAYAHSKVIVHLDLKPGNVMVGSFGQVHVMDWGLSQKVICPPNKRAGASRCDFDSSVENGLQVAGTFAYMSPEQARGRKVGLHSDVFGLGAILCEILTGDPPYTGTSGQEVYRRAASGSMRRVYQRLDSCGADRNLIDLAKACLSPQPADRPRDASVVASRMTDHVETSMERAEEDLHRFFEISMDLFCIATFDGYFKRVNPNFSRVLGYTNQQLVSRPFMDFIHPDDVEDTEKIVAKLFAGTPIVEFRNRYRDSKGCYRWFEWTAKPLPDEKVIFAVARDITDRIERNE